MPVLKHRSSFRPAGRAGEQISGKQLVLNQGTLYPALLKLEQAGWISSRWRESESGRRVRIYTLTRAGRKQLQKEDAQWQRAASIVERFLKISEMRLMSHEVREHMADIE